MENTPRIIFFGTPEFAASQLDAIIQAGLNVVAVVTVPDKPAGRGRKIQYSEVKKSALEHGLPLLQPEKLRDPEFLKQLESFQANLFIVVAFRMLPAVVWQMPKLGTFNLHASLLPQYRGAAPINHAIINGETTTGLTTFFLNEEIDKGAVIMRKSIPIRPDETAGELHDELMRLGNSVIVQTIDKIEKGEAKPLDQDKLSDGESLKTAPKITKEFCRINCNNDLQSAYNHIRGLSPYPAAHTTLVSAEGEAIEMKVYRAEMEPCTVNEKVGNIIGDGKKHMKITFHDGFLHLTDVQLSGKKRMKIDEFLRGKHVANGWKALF